MGIECKVAGGYHEWVEGNGGRGAGHYHCSRCQTCMFIPGILAELRTLRAQEEELAALRKQVAELEYDQRHLVSDNQGMVDCDLKMQEELVAKDARIAELRLQLSEADKICARCEDEVLPPTVHDELIALRAVRDAADMYIAHSAADIDTIRENYEGLEQALAAAEKVGK
jgi:hypothetical protein